MKVVLVVVGEGNNLPVGKTDDRRGGRERIVAVGFGTEGRAKSVKLFCSIDCSKKMLKC